jgi:hypothetical protein
MDISPEKSETMEFLGQDLAGREMVVENKCLQYLKMLNISD